MIEDLVRDLARTHRNLVTIKLIAIETCDLPKVLIEEAARSERFKNSGAFHSNPKEDPHDMDGTETSSGLTQPKLVLLSVLDVECIEDLDSYFVDAFDDVQDSYNGQDDYVYAVLFITPECVEYCGGEDAVYNTMRQHSDNYECLQCCILVTTDLKLSLKTYEECQVIAAEAVAKVPSFQRLKEAYLKELSQKTKLSALPVSSTLH